ADLHVALVMPRRLDHAPALDVVRDRLLDVDVLARLAGPDGGQGVPVVGGGDGHGGDVLVLEDVADVLLEARRLLLPRGDALERLGDDVLVGVAEVGDFNIVEGGEAADKVAPASVNAHDGEDDALVGFVGGARGAQGGQRGGGGGRSEEAASVEGGH